MVELQQMAINFESGPGLLMQQLHHTEIVHFSDYVWPIPSGVEFSLLESKPSLIQQHFITFLKVLSQDTSIMHKFGLFFVESRVLISFKSNLLKLLQLQLPFYTRGLYIYVALLDRPICFVFQLHWQVTWLSKNQAVGRHASGQFVCSSVSP